MESKQKILELIRRLEDLPEGNENFLRELIVDINFTIDEIFGPQSQYLGYIKYIKFCPDAVFVTDKERDRGWQDGVTQISNLLYVVLNDPKVKGRVLSKPQSPDAADLNQSASDSTSPIEENIQHSLEEFKETFRQEYSLIEEEGPIREPLRVDSVAMPGVSGERVPPEEESGGNGKKLHSCGRVLCVPGSNASINNEVEDFLKLLPADIIAIPKLVGQESLIDRLNQCVAAEFIVFILSADFHIYSRSQRPVDACLMASQEAIFQLGFLAGKFDRQKIVVLYQEEKDFLRPTEFFDLFYVPVTEAGDWKAEITRRMKGRSALPAGLGLSVKNQTSAQ